jgi:predicted transcriptional regulator
MKRVNLFLTLLIVSIAALITATVIGFALFSQTNQTNPYSWMSQMWGANANSNGNGNGGMGGGMMGGSTPTPTTTTNTMLPYYGALFAVLIALAVLAVVGISYYLVYPQIRMGAAPVPVQPVAATQTTPVTNGVSAYESVSKTLTEDERKIITTLQTHNGKYLQKYIKAETGLSRLQTHRILARLAERGMVSLEKTGNTNQVALANWLIQKQ